MASLGLAPLISSYSNGLRVLIEPLAERHRVLLAMLCSERLLPCYKAYSVAEKRGDYLFLVNCLNTLWEAVENNAPLPTAQITSWLEKFTPQREDDDDSIQGPDSLIPDAEMENSLFAWLALNTVGAFEIMLDCCLSASTEDTLRVANCAICAIDTYISELTGTLDNNEWTNAKERSEWYDAAPMLQEEKQIIERMVLILSQTPDLGRGTIQELRALARLNGIRPFRRNLVPDIALQDLKPSSPDRDFD